jgi:hypothetical protein
LSGGIVSEIAVLIAQYIDQIISLAAGVWVTALGYSRRYAVQSGGEPQQRKIVLIGKVFRTVGPLLIAVSLLTAAGKYYMS